MLKLIRADEIDEDTWAEEPVWVFHPDAIEDIHRGLGKRLITREEARTRTTLTSLAWEISLRVLRVQRWAGYYGVSTTALTVLATGLLDSRWRT